ncbi:MAG: hypothetical protein KGH88_04855 [Thaumarchaeota archaeon]|nr:hypothetical protein [Nitrososphaerota archaeon]
MRMIFTLSLVGVMLFGAMSPVLATTDLNAYIPINGALITPDFRFTHIVYLDYSQGGKLKNALDGKNMTISFNADSSSNTSVKNLVNKLNMAMASTGSSAKVTDLKLSYEAQINGGPTQASITYLINLVPTIGSYVLYQGTNNVAGAIGGGGTPYIMDAAWVGFNLNQDVKISTQQYGDLEINYPENMIQKELPAAYDVIKGTQAEKLLQQNLINPSTLYTQQPLDKWDHLFDPSYVVSDSNVLHYQGTKVAVTTFSTGVSNLQSGSMSNNQQDADFTADAPYHIRTIDQAASGTFSVEGHAQAYNVKGAPAFTTTATAAAGVSNTTAGGMSNMIMYGMAGGAGGIAVFVFIWSNKKTKATIYEIDTGPLQYETRQHWADHFASMPSSPVKTTTTQEQSDWLCFKCGYYTLNSQDHCSNCGAVKPPAT